jgi:hypothetical protein
MFQISKPIRKSALCFLFGICSLCLSQGAFAENWVKYDGSFVLYCEEDGVYGGDEEISRHMKRNVCDTVDNNFRNNYYTRHAYDRFQLEFDMDSRSQNEGYQEINVKISLPTSPDFIIVSTYQANCNLFMVRQISSFREVRPGVQEAVQFNQKWRNAYEYKRAIMQPSEPSVESVIFDVTCGI